VALSTREMPKSEEKSEKKWKNMKKKIARRMSIGSRYLEYRMIYTIL